MNTRGFTLVELVIVIVLLGILSAVSVPRYVDSNNDARRVVNNTTAAALNTAITAALQKAKITGTLISTATANNTYSTTTAPIVLNIDNNPDIQLNNYIGFYSNTVLIPYGAGIAAYKSLSETTGPDFQNSYADLNKSPNTQGCINLFNALMGSSSVQTGTTTTNAYITLTTAKTINTVNGIAANTFNSSGTPQPLNSTSFAYASSVYTATPTIVPFPPSSASTTGLCLYQLNNTSNTKFYIIYDPIGINFYTGEL